MRPQTFFEVDLQSTEDDIDNCCESLPSIRVPMLDKYAGIPKKQCPRTK